MEQSLFQKTQSFDSLSSQLDFWIVFQKHFEDKITMKRLESVSKTSEFITKDRMKLEKAFNLPNEVEISSSFPNLASFKPYTEKQLESVSNLRKSISEFEKFASQNLSQRDTQDLLIKISYECERDFSEIYTNPEKL